MRFIPLILCILSNSRELLQCFRWRRRVAPRLGDVCPHAPALVGQWETVRRRRALVVSYAHRTARGHCPYAPECERGRMMDGLGVWLAE